MIISIGRQYFMNNALIKSFQSIVPKFSFKFRHTAVQREFVQQRIVQMSQARENLHLTSERCKRTLLESEGCRTLQQKPRARTVIHQRALMSWQSPQTLPALHRLSTAHEQALTSYIKDSELCFSTITCITARRFRTDGRAV